MGSRRPRARRTARRWEGLVPWDPWMRPRSRPRRRARRSPRQQGRHGTGHGGRGPGRQRTREPAGGARGGAPLSAPWLLRGRHRRACTHSFADRSVSTTIIRRAGRADGAHGTRMLPSPACRTCSPARPPDRPRRARCWPASRGWSRLQPAPGVETTIVFAVPGAALAIEVREYQARRWPQGLARA